LAFSGGAVAANVFIYFTGGSDVNFNSSSKFSGVLVVNSSQSRNISFNGTTIVAGHVFNLTAGQINFNSGTFQGEIGPGVSLSPTSLSFGSQLLGSASAPQTITLTNTGSSALTITSIATSGDFAQTNNCGSSIAANGSCTVSVTFHPSATGNRTGSLTVNAGGITNTVSLSGTGTAPGPVLNTNPANLSFASAVVGSTATAQTVTVTNSGTTSATVSAVAVTGDFSQTNNCGTVAVGAQHDGDAGIGSTHLANFIQPASVNVELVHQFNGPSAVIPHPINTQQTDLSFYGVAANKKRVLVFAFQTDLEGK